LAFDVFVHNSNDLLHDVIVLDSDIVEGAGDTRIKYRHFGFEVVIIHA
jgi:hypothetical protein